MGTTPDDAEIIACGNAEEWEAWLAERHGTSAGTWLKIAKKGSGETSVTISDALDVALCYGWIDSVRRSYDDRFYLQRYSPRRPRSAWSQVNVEKVEALIATGRMQPAGLVQVEAAQADGRWAAAYESQRNAKAPPDLVAALEANPRAKATFDQLGKTDRYLVILQLLKTPTRERRAVVLERVVAELAAREA
jgi:uncharacterized protein YdeI (YjbR/CyaY-like superfamily)